MVLHTVLVVAGVISIALGAVFPFPWVGKGIAVVVGVLCGVTGCCLLGHATGRWFRERRMTRLFRMQILIMGVVISVGVPGAMFRGAVPLDIEPVSGFSAEYLCLAMWSTLAFLYSGSNVLRMVADRHIRDPGQEDVRPPMTEFWKEEQARMWAEEVRIARENGVVIDDGSGDIARWPR